MLLGDEPRRPATPGPFAVQARGSARPPYTTGAELHAILPSPLHPPQGPQVPRPRRAVGSVAHQEVMSGGPVWSWVPSGGRNWPGEGSAGPVG